MTHYSKDAPSVGFTIPPRALPHKNPAERLESRHLFSPLRHDTGLSDPLKRLLSTPRGSFPTSAPPDASNIGPIPPHKPHPEGTYTPSEPYPPLHIPPNTLLALLHPSRRVLRRSYNLLYIRYTNKKLPTHHFTDYDNATKYTTTTIYRPHPDDNMTKWGHVLGGGG